jgi:Domain of unknown function (DUF5666)
MRRFAILAAALLGVAALLLTGCGNGGSSAPSTVAGGGIGGTGKGTVTGYGSVILDGTREFEIAGQTDIRLDGAPTDETTLRGLGIGLVARVIVGSDVDADFTRGTALSIDVDRLAIGPVTAPGPGLQVLGQAVVVPADAVLVPADLDLSTLTDQDVLAVSGYASADNVLLATRLERLSAAPEWKLTGPVSGLLPGVSLLIGTQAVSLAGVSPADCGAGLANGDWVDIRAVPDASFLAGSTLSGVTSLTCFDPHLPPPPGLVRGSVPASINGLVSSDPVLLPLFAVEGQDVLVNGGTIYHGGAPEDISTGVQLQVQGMLDLATGILTAKQVRFAQVRVRIRAPLNPGDVVIGTQVTMLGIAVHATVLTMDLAKVLDGISSAGQYQVHGHLDKDGTVYADRIVGNGMPNYNNVKLRGPVGAVTGPHGFTILGVAINTSGTTLFYDPDGTPLTEADFLARLSSGVQVQVSGATYDAGTGALSNAESMALQE